MQDPGTNPLSQLAHELINSAQYDKLTPESRRAPFTASPEQLFAVPVANPAAAWAMLAGLYLWHDDLERSHEIAQKSPSDLALFPHQTPSKTALKVQSVESVQSGKAQKTQQLEDMTASLAFWHAIMHRREGDFWNSKYWYARCRHHPALAEIPVHAESVIQQLPGLREVERLTRSGWEADGFVDLVEAVHQKPSDPRHAAAVRLQQIEWQVLFDHCVHAASGRA